MKYEIMVRVRNGFDIKAEIAVDGGPDRLVVEEAIERGDEIPAVQNTIAYLKKLYRGKPYTYTVEMRINN